MHKFWQAKSTFSKKINSTALAFVSVCVSICMFAFWLGELQH